MEKYSKNNLKNIQVIVQDKTGVDIGESKSLHGGAVRWAALIACCLLCLVPLSAFAYAKFSSLDEDDLGFVAAYQGDGKFEIVVQNDSDRDLTLQEHIKVMQWSTAKEVDGDPGKIRMTSLTIAPHSQGIVSIDLSDGYDVEAMAENLPDGDWYYFILTNNYFAFGQDWMCSFDFEVVQTEEAADNLTESMEQRAQRYAAEQNKTAQGTEGQGVTEQNGTEWSGIEQNGTGQSVEELQDSTADLRNSDWIWPTVSQNVSSAYGEQGNGKFSDHMNIAGAVGDEVYAVADGVVVETGFESSEGNFIVADLGEGIIVKYGHLKEIHVSVGDEITQGQVIAELGKSGIATGPNLLFAVTVDGEAVNPLMENSSN